MQEMNGQFAICKPPYEVGELLYLPNSWPSIIEILSFGYGKPVKLHYSGDEVYMSPYSIYRPLIGYPAGKYIYIVMPSGISEYMTDITPPIDMTEFTPTGHPVPFPASQKGIDFMNKKIQEIIDARNL